MINLFYGDCVEVRKQTALHAIRFNRMFYQIDSVVRLLVQSFCLSKLLTLKSYNRIIVKNDLIYLAKTSIFEIPMSLRCCQLWSNQGYLGLFLVCY